MQAEDVKVPGARVEPGFSGGPVLDETLEGVVGIISMADTESQNKISFIIPIDIIAKVLPELKIENTDDSSATYHEIRRPQINLDLIVSRDHDLEQVDRLLSQNHALAITGLMGIGKSTLISMYVEKIQKANKYEGIYWHKFDKNIEVIDLIKSFFESIHKPVKQFPHNLDQQLFIFFNELMRKPYLLVFDNFEALLDPKTNKILEPGFSELIEWTDQKNGESRILLTCQELPYGERGIRPEQFRLHGLDSQAALELMHKRGLEGTEYELEEAARQRSDGHPHALILLAQLVKDTSKPLSRLLANDHLWKRNVAENILNQVYLLLSDDEQKLLQYVSI